jgi:hypothetical protein
MREPQITLTCDCGATGSTAYGEKWQCEACGRTYDTSKIPREEYDAVLRSVRWYRLVALGPPFAFAAVLVPLAILVNVRYAFLLFVLVLAHGLLVMPQVRRRATAKVRTGAPSWKLRPE